VNKIQKLAKAIRELAEEDNDWLRPDFLFEAYENAGLKVPKYGGHADYNQLVNDMKVLLKENSFSLFVKTAIEVIINDYCKLADRPCRVTAMLPTNDILWDQNKMKKPDGSKKGPCGVTNLSEFRKKKK